MAKPHELTAQNPLSPRAFAKATQKAVVARGGWNGSWAIRMGLTRAMVTNWKARGRIPGYWRLALKSALRAAK